MKIADLLVQNEESQDDSLHMKAAPVNMRLFRSNIAYRRLIRKIIAYMQDVVDTETADYGPLKGLSGANIGIPLNIIIVIFSGEYSKVMINPKIVSSTPKTKKIESNCGSLNLSKPIEVERNEEIWVEYYNTEGERQRKSFDLKKRGGTIQHEIDHNLGILITDKNK